jgi:disease resistance protein RPS2
LPLLIDKVARAFRSKKDNYALWEEGLSSLQKWPNAKVQGMNELIEVLKFCYDELGAEDIKVCFLYGVLYHENCEIYIDHLLECWKAEGFIHDAKDFRDARNKGQKILHDLILRSLLEGSDRMNYVKMNKVLRNMVIDISSKSNNLKVLVIIH